MVTVIGPTPPGTGVTFLHFLRSCSLNSTSPHIVDLPFKSSTKLMPTSITTVSYRIHSDFISPGTPHAAMTILAFYTAYFKRCSGVNLKLVVTKALYLLSSKYMGIPTILLLPIRATRFPLRASVDP